MVDVLLFSSIKLATGHDRKNNQVLKWTIKYQILTKSIFCKIMMFNISIL